MPKANGVAARLDAWLAMHRDMPGAPFFSAMVKFAVKTFGFDPDPFVHELVDSITATTIPFRTGCSSITSKSSTST